MNRRRRACDRCAALKAQCSEDAPCGRCQRLSLECTHTRPVRARGRPRKGGFSRALRSSSGSTEPNAMTEPSLPQNPISNLLLPSQHLPIDRTLASELLAQVLSNVHRIGMLSACRRVDYAAMVTEEEHGWTSFLTSRSVQCVLMACGFLLDSKRADSKMLAENCRMHALSDIPILTWKSRPIRPGDIYCLYILSNLTYLQEGTTEIADRWAALASCLQSVSRVPMFEDDPKLAEASRRIACLVDMNNEVQRLLFSRPYGGKELPSASSEEPASIPGKVPACYPQVADHDWHHLHLMEYYSSKDEELPYGDYDTPKLREGFFDLFLPLLEPLRAALARPSFDDVTYRHAVDCLEHYFISFPTRLMHLSTLTCPWQYEAMIWFHGIFILLNDGRDFLEILFNSGYMKSEACAHAAEHAVLIGDLLQSLAPSSDMATLFNPATIFFIALSATLHSSLLPLVDQEHLRHRDVLLASARSHEQILQALIDNNNYQTCDHVVIRSTLEILRTNIGHCVDPHTFERSGVEEHVERLKHFRWVTGGHGLINLDDETANLLLQRTLDKVEHAEDAGRPLVALSVCNPDARICQPGTFDYSILH